MDSALKVAIVTITLIAVLLSVGFGLYLPFYIRRCKQVAPERMRLRPPIALVRALSWLVFWVGWPVLSFAIPFFFSTDKAINSLWFQAVLAVYVAYPVGLIASAFVFRKKLMEERHQVAAVAAAGPLLLLVLMSAVVWLG